MSRRRAVPLAVAAVAAALVVTPVAGWGSGLTGALWSDSVTFDSAISVVPDAGAPPSLEVTGSNPLCWGGSGNLTLTFGLKVVPGGFTHLHVEVGGIGNKPSGQHHLQIGGVEYEFPRDGTRIIALGDLTADPPGTYPAELMMHQSVNKQAYLVIRLSDADGSSTSEQVVQVGPTGGGCIDIPEP